MAIAVTGLHFTCTSTVFSVEV